MARGAPVNHRGSYGYTPLMMAAGSFQPQIAMVRFLLDSGAELPPYDGGGTLDIVRPPPFTGMCAGDASPLPDGACPGGTSSDGGMIADQNADTAHASETTHNVYFTVPDATGVSRSRIWIA